jgi:hypothetical protein
MWPFKEIANTDLTENDLPHFSGKWDQPLIRFALSFTGYDYFASQPSSDNIPPNRKLGHFANRSLRSYEVEKSLPDSLSQLRACLFFEQRRWHYLRSSVGSYVAFDRDGRAMIYIHALLEAIALKIRAGEAE